MIGIARMAKYAEISNVKSKPKNIASTFRGKKLKFYFSFRTAVSKYLRGDPKIKNIS